MEKIDLPSLALYIHWPFCLSKCPYCDFNSHVRASIDEDRWQEGLLQELTQTAELTGPRRLTSIFFGGGTPSLMPPKTVAALIDQACQLWSPEPGFEITLEANPNSVEARRFQDFKTAGINRLSVGIQALNDPDLKALGRQHSAEEAIAALKIATQTFDRVSFDLIYARPHQTLNAWQEELERALSFSTEHLSLYQLTIEPGTAFAPLYERGELVIPDEELAADLYELTQERTEAAGLPAYEISNHARLGCESRHNLAYWKYQDYAGVGPGAHGRITLKDGVKLATKQLRAPETWLKQVFSLGHGHDESETIRSFETQAQEALLMGLRLKEGIDLKKLPLPWPQLIDQKRLNPLIEAGFLILKNDDHLMATQAGRQRLNAILRSLLT